MLWDQLVRKSGWKVEKSWEKVSISPSEFLNQTEGKINFKIVTVGYYLIPTKNGTNLMKKSL